MKKTGISLIVLIVTIIVIIILAAVVILTLSKNNPIESSKEASFKEDVRTFQDELAMYISKDYTSKAGQRDGKITETDSSKIKDYIPSFSKKYEGKFVIKNDELMYSEGKLTDDEQKWSNSLNVKVNAKTGAEKAKEDPAKYYGAKVTNYTANGISDWKIFYSDGSNVYLITSEYVDPTILPSKGEGDNPPKPDQGDAVTYPKAARFNNILLEKYSGSSDITDEKMKAFNSDYFDKNYTSTNNNMKAVAYMLNKDIWGDFANRTVAEYAVGGPSVEMLLKSYCDKYPDKKDLYKTQASSAIGYLVSNNGGTSYTTYISGMKRSDDRLYVLPGTNTTLESGNKSGANAMWLISPSAHYGNDVMVVTGNGIVDCGYSYNDSKVGFRPLVCLNSNILLNEVSGGFEIQ